MILNSPQTDEPPLGLSPATAHWILWNSRMDMQNLVGAASPVNHRSIYRRRPAVAAMVLRSILACGGAIRPRCTDSEISIGAASAPESRQ